MFATRGFSSAISRFAELRDGDELYLVSEIGNDGVPTPKPADVAKLKTIPKSSTMWFVYTKAPQYSFVVFDATLQQMCDPDHPPFFDWAGPER